MKYFIFGLGKFFRYISLAVITYIAGLSLVYLFGDVADIWEASKYGILGALQITIANLIVDLTRQSE